MTVECPHGEVEGMPCPACDRHRTATVGRDRPDGWSAAFHARWPGRCSGCRGEFAADDLIRSRRVGVSGEVRVYAHVGVCVDDAEAGL